MKASLDHVKINVSDVGFYKNFLTYLGFEIYKEHPGGFGVKKGEIGIWVYSTPGQHIRDFNYQTTGLNHLAFKVESKEAVNKFYKDYLLPKRISVLDEPKEYPYEEGYYAVFFEDPDHIKLEVVYKP